MTTKLFLYFSLNGERYAVHTDHITEITPLVNLTVIPKTEHYVCGIMNYRGESIPVIDAVKLLYDIPYGKKICTRIIIITLHNNNQAERVGLIVEKVNMTKKVDLDNISTHTLTQPHTPYLGEIINDPLGDIQVLNLASIIPSESGCLPSIATC